VTAPLPPGADTGVANGRWDDRAFDRADGTNGMISYNGGSFPIRAKKVEHSWEVIYTESHARSVRAFYPHQRAPGRFAITLQLSGYTAYKAFTEFMMGYIREFAHPANTYSPGLQYAMTVSVPVRDFQRIGIPVGGIADTDHVGSMVFEPTILFEAMSDPLDPTIYSPFGENVSQPDMVVGGDQAQFFYPFSPASENASIVADSILYDARQTASGSVNSLINTITNANRNAFNPLPPGTGGTGGSTAPLGSSGIPGSPF
jgi:hypothetical protein